MLRQRMFPDDLLKEGIIARMRGYGLEVDSNVRFPQMPQQLLLGPPLGHLCFGDDLEVFPLGVPVLSSIIVTQDGGTRWKGSLPYGTAPYWTGEIRLTHEWNRPPLRGRRLLHFLEAAALLTLYPGLGAVRYYSQNATDGYAELFVNRDGKFRVWCGSRETPKSHHLATVAGPSTYRIDETNR